MDRKAARTVLLIIIFVLFVIIYGDSARNLFFFSPKILVNRIGPSRISREAGIRLTGVISDARPIRDGDEWDANCPPPVDVEWKPRTDSNVIPSSAEREVDER